MVPGLYFTAGTAYRQSQQSSGGSGHCTLIHALLVMYWYNEKKTSSRSQVQCIERTCRDKNDTCGSSQQSQSELQPTADWLYCLLRASHLYHLGSSRTINCMPSETGPQTPVLRVLALYKTARTQHWPQGPTLAEKLRNFKEDMLQTTKFINTIELDSVFYAQSTIAVI